jgi:hypothetical protein
MEIQKAWLASNPYATDRRDRREQGFFVLRDNKTGALSVRAYDDASPRYNGIRPGARPVVADHDVIATFHTHPNRDLNAGPSPFVSMRPNERGDIGTNEIGFQIPGIIMSHEGLFFYGPPLKPF